jgi:glycosyltransferase involved in cell wall biosynthesis
VRVLIVNQTGQMSGAERSLLTLIDFLSAETSVVAAAPAGDLVEQLVRRDVPVRPLRGTDASFRLHPLHTPRALAELATAAWSTARIARSEGAQLVHANTTRAGLIALGARRLGGPPVLVHIRDWVPAGRPARVVMSLIRRQAAAVVANSRFAAEQLPPGRAPVEVISNPVDLRRFDPDGFDRSVSRARLGIEPEDELLAVVGQITPWKGQAEAVRALAAVRRIRPRARLVIAGSAKFAAASTRYDNAAYDRELRSLPARLGVEGAVGFLGERDDVAEVMAAADVLLVPSWREAFGRVAVEGMAMGVPVVVTAVGGPAELVRDGVEGRVLPPRDPEQWAGAILELLADRTKRERMGAAGRARARSISDPAAHARAIEAVYRRIAR